MRNRIDRENLVHQKLFEQEMQTAFKDSAFIQAIEEQRCRLNDGRSQGNVDHALLLWIMNQIWERVEKNEPENFDLNQ